MKDKKYHKVRDHCHYTERYRSAAHSICNLKCSVRRKIPITFHNGSNYDYNFIMKELVEEFEKQFNFLEENTERNIASTVPKEKKVTRIVINREELAKNIFQILQFTDSARFMTSSLSNLVNSFSEGIYEIEYKYGHGDQKCETCVIK